MEEKTIFLCEGCGREFEITEEMYLFPSYPDNIHFLSGFCFDCCYPDMSSGTTSPEELIKLNSNQCGSALLRSEKEEAGI